MKNLVSILFSLIFIISCNNDDNKQTHPEILENHFVYQGNEFQLEDYSYYYDYEENYLRIDLMDVGENSQNKISFLLFGIQWSELDGIYTYMEDYESPDYNPNSNFYNAILTYSSDGNDPEEYYINDGQIEAHVDGTDLEIKFEIETNDGTATGYFKGQLIENN